MPYANNPPSSQRELQRVILDRIASGAPLKETLDYLCEMVATMVPDSVCSVMQLNAEKNSLSFIGAPCLPEPAWVDLDGLVPSAMAGSCGTAVFTREPAIVEDVLTDPRWASLRDVARKYGLRACWSIPLLREGSAMGSFAISRTVKGGPTDEQMQLLVTAANMASLALGRVEDERDLDEQRALMTSLFASVADPVFVKDEDGRYLLANEAEASGVVENPEAMVGKTDDEIYGTEIAESNREQDLAVMRSGETLDFRQTYENAIHGPSTYLIRKSPMRDAKGKIRGIVGVARDVTKLERTEAILQQAQRAESLGILAGGVAHDFNNLLTGILGNCSLALPHSPPGSHLRKLLDEIEHAASRAAELTDQMLAYAGRAETHKGPVAIGPLVHEVLGLVSSSLAHRTHIEFDDQGGGALVRADASQIRQVVLNLVTNGSQALEGRAGRVRLTLNSTHEEVHLSVYDEGLGMDEATLKRVFEPFFSTKTHGRGLGLASALGIARAHSGSLECESSPGVGTKFTLCLPRCNAEADEPATGRRTIGGGGVILIADDHESVRSLARRVLEPTGHRVIEASDGHEALELSRKHADELDLLLLDVRMPGLRGDEVLTRLRSEGIDCAAMLSSGYTRESTAGLLPPGVGFLKKPYRPADLLSAVLSARGV